MKYFKILFVFIWLIIFSGLTTSCSSSGEFTSRRNLMMPDKSDLPRNSKYQAPKKKKTYGAQHKNKKKKKR